MNDQDPGSDFILSAIRRARAERAAAAPAGAAGSVPGAGVGPGVGVGVRPEPGPAPTTAAWEALSAFAPDPRHLERRLIRTLHGGAAAKPFDMIRTRLLHQMRSNGWRRVAITSPSSGCGKTMLSVNLALSLARQGDTATMAVELDMRRPAMAGLLGLRAGHQIAEALAGRAAAEACMVRVGSNLALATNHHPVPEAAELLASREAAHVLDRVEAEFAPDVMLFDLPPLMLTDDAMAFMDQIDCVLLLAAAERNTMAEITRCAEDLAGRCNFLGVILNKCRFMGDEERYGYGPSYGEA